jgi:hypothetical protein
VSPLGKLAFLNHTEGAYHAELSPKAGIAEADYRAEQDSGRIANARRKDSGRADQAGGLEQAWFDFQGG